jgi:hypothetical protein
MQRTVGAWWGLIGVALLLGSAIYRMTPMAVNAFAFEFCWYHTTVLAAVVFFMAYVEGYQAFQQGFSPRVAARALYLKQHGRLSHMIFAPLFCMGFFHARRRRQITSISVTAGIIVLVLLVRLLDQPWRGIVDAGVVVGLAWGLVSLVLFGFQALTSGTAPCSPEVSE